VNPWFLRDAPEFQIVPELLPLPTEGVFDKLTMSAFEGTWLDFALRDCGINAFIIVGVATEIGIEPDCAARCRSRLYSGARNGRLRRRQ
jgi:nicotinamidase-related amidase